MKTFIPGRATSFWAVCLLLSATILLSTASLLAAEKVEYRAVGSFVEGCSCGIPCTCDVTGAKHGCQGIGAMVFTSGTYKGVDLAGAKFAYATAPGSWIRFYVDAKNAQQEEAVTEFAKASYREFGKLEAVRKASIAFSGKGGRYTLSVDGGKIIQLTTEPVLGADKKTPITYSNVFQPLSPTVMQGKTLKGSYHDGERSFTLEGSNSYFNPGAKSSGKV